MLLAWIKGLDTKARPCFLLTTSAGKWGSL